MKAKKNLIFLSLILSMATPVALTFVASQESPKPSKLVIGKLIYVAPMPENLDQWITDDLRAWNKYQITANSEGVDIVVRAQVPEKQTRFTMRQGVPQPAKEKQKPPVPSVQAIEWVSGKTLWEADILDEKPKRDQSETPSSHTQIYARGLSPDQLGMAVTRKLREYVEDLQKAARGSQ